MPFVWRRSDCEVRNVNDTADPAQAVANDFCFRFELRLIIELLEIAAAAAAKVWTRRLDPHRRGLDDFNYGSEGDLSLYAVDADAHPIARRGQRHQNGAAISVREAHSARQNSLDSNFKALRLARSA